MAYCRKLRFALRSSDFGAFASQLGHVNIGATVTDFLVDLAN